MKLWKAHCLGNDYLVWEGGAGLLDAGAVRRICSRHYGVGGDGVLEPVSSSSADFGVRIWNPDGSVAEKSGNGLRIFAFWLSARRGAGLSISIDTGSCLVTAQVEPSSRTVRVGMGPPLFEPSQIPCTEPVWGREIEVCGAVLTLWAAGVGNPHCVAFFPRETDLDSLPWRDWGRSLERNPLFPNRTNVQFAHVVDRGGIALRIWERGAGATEASGSSASAVFAIANRLGWVGDEASLLMPGGCLEVGIGPAGIHNSGPVQEVAELSLLPGFLV
jgi:diaminopimelate epimerase